MFNGTNRKRSWSELLAAVKATRSLCLSGRQSTRTPNNFTFSDTKLYFLALPENRSEYTLFYVDLKPGEQGEQPAIVPSAQWHLLLDLDSLRPFQGFSREEQLLRERKRMGSFGITSYEYDKNSRSILFPACSSLYMCRDHVLPSVSVRINNHVEMLICKILSSRPCSMECKHCASDMSGAIAIYLLVSGAHIRCFEKRSTPPPPERKYLQGGGGGGKEKFVSDNKCIRISEGDLGD